MASNHGNTHSELPNSEQIITELFSKILQIILESRCPHVYSQKFRGEKAVISPPTSSSSSSSSSNIRSRDKWFNLAVRDCSAALEKLDFRHQTKFEPMVIDVILVQPSSEKILERWVVQYVNGKEDSSSSAKRWRSTCLHALYRKSILLLRSLYSVLRFLPAYKFFRDLNSSCQIAHRVSTFAEPFTRVEESEMKQFLFTSLETISGRLSLSVIYIPSISEAKSDQSSSRLPISSPQVISQYIENPLSNPSKNFPSLVCSPSPPPPVSIAVSGLASNHSLLPLPPPNCSRPNAPMSGRKSHLAQKSPADDKQKCPFGKSSSESGRHLAVKTSFSSRLSSFENKFDDSEFCGAFVVDEDMTGSNTLSCRRGYFDDEKGGKQDAAVGALIQMLNRAAPLHGAVVKPSRFGVQSMPRRMNRASSGERLLGKTTADALEELRGYRDIKQNGVAATTTLNQQ